MINTNSKQNSKKAMTGEEADQKYWIVAKDTADLTQKLHLLKTGASCGGKLCQNELGEMYMNGRGVPKDMDKAADYFLKAAKSGQPAAMFWLSLIYVNHWDDEQHYFEALELLAESAKRCFIPAFEAIERNCNGYKEFKECIAPFIRPGFEEVMKKEEKDSTDYYFLGLCHVYGVICDKDEYKAREYIQRATDMGNPYSGVLLNYPHLRIR